jgi:type IV secretory pathway VirB6-like protein
MLVIHSILRTSLVGRLLALLLVSSVLAACTNITPDPVCVGSQDLGNQSKNNITLYAATQTDASGNVKQQGGSWVDTGISAMGGGGFGMAFTGNITTCANSNACSGENGAFVQVYVGSLVDGVPPAGATIIDIGSTGTYSGTADATGGRIYVHINDADRDYSSYSSANAPFNFMQCNVTAFQSYVPAPYDYCVKAINSFTHATYESPSHVVTSIGHAIDESVGTQMGQVQCNIMAVTADDGTLSTTNPSTAYECMTKLNAALASASPVDFSGCTVRTFTSDSASDKSTCVNLLNHFLSSTNYISDSNGTISGSSPCFVTDATGTTSGLSSTGNCKNDLNSAATHSSGIASTSANSGAYLVSVSASTAPDTKFSGLLTTIISSVRELLQGSGTRRGLTEKMYGSVVANDEFILGVKAFIALSIVFMAFRYMVGLSQVSHKEVISFVIKMAVVLAMATPGSWAFFSKYVFAIFLQGTDSLSYLMSHNINDLVVRGFNDTAIMTGSSGTSGAGQADSVFAFLDFTMSILFSKEANIKLSAILLSFPLGPVIAIAIYIGVFYFLIAVGKALLTYITSIVMVALLLIMAPLCISFLMFNKTKAIFDSWIKLLASFALQPVLLIMLLSIFNVFLLLSLYDILNFTACFTCVWNTELPLFGKFCGLYGYSPWGIDPSLNIAQKLTRTPVGLIYALIFVILTNIMTKFSQFVETLASELSAEGTGTSLGSIVERGAGEMKIMAKQAAATAKDAVKYTAKRADYLTGHVVSDAAIKATRTALPSFVKKGGVDETGRKLDVSERFMTSKERAGYKKDLKAFRSLDKNAQQGVIDRNQEQRALDKAGELNIRKEIYGNTLPQRLGQYALSMISPLDRARNLGGTSKGQELNKRIAFARATSGRADQLKEFQKLGSNSDNFWSRNTLGGAERLQKFMDTRDILESKYDANKANAYNKKEGESLADFEARKSKLREEHNADLWHYKGERAQHNKDLVVKANDIFKRYDEMQQKDSKKSSDKKAERKILAEESKNTFYSGDRKVQRQSDGSYKIEKKE